MDFNGVLDQARDIIIELLDENGIPKVLGYLIAEYLYSSYEEEHERNRRALKGIDPYFVMCHMLTALKKGRSPLDIVHNPLEILTEGIPTKEVVHPKEGRYLWLSREDHFKLQAAGDPYAAKNLAPDLIGTVYRQNDSPLLIKFLKEGRIFREDKELHLIYDHQALAFSRFVHEKDDTIQFYINQVFEGVSVVIPWF